MAGIGAPELIIVLVIVVVLFGAKRLPDLGRSLGSGMREFKSAVTGGEDDPAALDASSDDVDGQRRRDGEDASPQPRA